MMDGPDLEHKFSPTESGKLRARGAEIEGYASYFGKTDNGGDVVMPK